MVGNSTSVKNFYSISNGKICKSYGGNQPENVPTAKSRVNKNGNTVWEEHFDFIKGKIVDAKLHSHEEFGEFIILTFDDGQDVANLQFKFDSAYGRSFLFKLSNIDVSAIITITPYSFTDKEGRQRLGVTILDPIEKVQNMYSKENPHGLPPMKKVTFKGKESWDNTEQIEFLKKEFDVFCEKINQNKTVSQTENIVDVEDTFERIDTSNNQDENPDDLPF